MAASVTSTIIAVVRTPMRAVRTARSAPSGGGVHAAASDPPTIASSEPTTSPPAAIGKAIRPPMTDSRPNAPDAPGYQTISRPNAVIRRPRPRPYTATPAEKKVGPKEKLK